MSVRQKVSCIGVGRLGLCLALSLERAGFDVLGSDIFPDYIRALNDKTFRSREPGVNEALAASTAFVATLSLDEIVEHSDVIFIVCATPTGGGRNCYDHSTLGRILADLAKRHISNKHIVISCTVLPGYIKRVGRELLADCPGCTLSYNPEFIAQGAIMAGLAKPDMLLIGEGSPAAGDAIEAIYRQMNGPDVPVHRMSPESAEICKLSLNCFVTTKITFANMIGDIADATPGADKFEILRAVGADARVGSKCLLPGAGYGGPCFPRDNRALGTYATSVGIDPLLSVATDRYNVLHADIQTAKLLQSYQAEHRTDGEGIIFEDVAYKPGCPVDIIEESQKLVIAEKLALKGVPVIIHDRVGIIDLVRQEYGNLFTYI